MDDSPATVERHAGDNTAEALPSHASATPAEGRQPVGLGINSRPMSSHDPSHTAAFALLPTPDGTPTDLGSRSPKSAIGDSHGPPMTEIPSKLRALVINTDTDTDTTAAVTDTDQGQRSQSASSSTTKLRRLSATKIQELASSPESLPVAPIPSRRLADYPLSAGLVEAAARPSMAEQARDLLQGSLPLERTSRVAMERTGSSSGSGPGSSSARPSAYPRTLSTPPISRRKSSSQPPNLTSNRRNSFHPTPRLGGVPIPAPLNLEGKTTSGPQVPNQQPPLSSEMMPASSPVNHTTLPLPPMSVPTFLQLELAGQRPSPLYIHHPSSKDVPYESSAVKFTRLKNFLQVPPSLERTILFGALACLDAWLWTFTILPIRFIIAAGVLVKWWGYVVAKEARWAIGYVWYGLGRWWRRGARGRSASRADDGRSSAGESRSPSRARGVSTSTATGLNVNGSSNGGVHLRPRRAESRTSYREQEPVQRQTSRRSFRRRRTKSTPSGLTSFHKADILQGLIIVFTCIALMRLDASRMYHSIRAQSAIKLYVIYNGLEVGDRLLSALGQDIFECLFSTEVLARDHLGRSKVMVPFGMFLLALVYNFAHSVTLFYQVITLNVAVNSYSNALLTLLISNQFVEIKSSVFKRFEKENIFQLTCADIVERFQLWLMLLIIAMRNIVEVGGLTIPGAGTGGGGGGISAGGGGSDSPWKLPLHSASILPASFTALPSWLWSGEVLSPFLIVTGSETVVDAIKHAYISKFNNIKPNFYSRVLDILCKDYYTNVFVTPSLTRRLGLPLLPLSCLFIRASVQTYHMFMATYLPSPLPPSTQTSLVVESVSAATPSSQAVAASLERLDTLIRSALGRAVHGLPTFFNSTDGPTMAANPNGSSPPIDLPRHLFLNWTTDDVIASVTMLTVFFIAFLVLLLLKLVLGMVLLRYSRRRYAAMRRREQAVAAGRAEPEEFDQKGSRRVGGYGYVEVGDERRATLYEDDPEGLRKQQNTERRNAGKREKSEKDLGRISRYEMVAKRIW